MKKKTYISPEIVLVGMDTECIMDVVSGQLDVKDNIPEQDNEDENMFSKVHTNIWETDEEEIESGLQW